MIFLILTVFYKISKLPVTTRQLFGVELRSEADDFIRLTFENMEPSRLFYSSYLI